MAVEELCKRFAANLRSSSRAPILVSGAPGYGKTWTAELLARWSRENLPEELHTAQPLPVCVIEHHVDQGGSGSSRRHIEIIRAVLQQLKHTFGLEKEVPSAEQEEVLIGSLAEWAQLASACGPTVLIIDGVDELEDYRDALRLSWLPDPPPTADSTSRPMTAPGFGTPPPSRQSSTVQGGGRFRWRYPFQIVVTARPDGISFESVQPRGWSMWSVRSPSPAAAREIWDVLQEEEEEEEAERRGGGEGWEPVREVLVEMSEHVRMSPRFIEVLLGEVRAEPRQERRPDLCRQLVASAAGGSVQSLYEARIRRLAKRCDGDAPLFRRVLAWLWVAKRGLTCAELEGLLRAKFGLGNQRVSAPAAASDDERAERVLVAALRPERLRSRHDFCALLDSQMRAAVASTCLGEAGVAEADLHYQVATYFLEVYGPEMPRYVDLAWHLRQAQDQATLWNVITQPRALRHFLGEGGAAAAGTTGGAKLEFLKFCRFCRPAADDSYSAVLTQLLVEIEAEEFDLAVVERTARLAQEVGCHQQALLLFRQCNLHLQESEEEEPGLGLGSPPATSRPAVGGMTAATAASSSRDGDGRVRTRDSTRVRRAGFLCEIANLHVRHNVPREPGAPLAATRKEASDLLVGALALLDATEQTAPSSGLLGAGESEEQSFPPPGMMSSEVKVMAAVHHVLGMLNYFEGEYAQAAWYGHYAVLGRRAQGELVAAADSLNLCGSIAYKSAVLMAADRPVAATVDTVEADSPLVGDRLAADLQRRKLLQQAEQNFEESLAIRQRLLSGNDPAIAQVLNSLGDFHRTQGNLADASKFYRRSRQVYANSLGARHYKCAYPTEGLAQIAHAQGSAREACRLLETALEMCASQGMGSQPTQRQQLLDAWRVELAGGGPVSTTSQPVPATNESSKPLHPPRLRSRDSDRSAGQLMRAGPSCDAGGMGGGQRFQEAASTFWDRIGTLLAERGGEINNITRTEREELVYTLLRQIDPILVDTVRTSVKSEPLKMVSKSIRYDARRVLGLGSMGTKVFRGSYRRSLEEGGGEVAVAVKRVDRELASAITREAKALRAVAAHPHVVQLYGYVDDTNLDPEFAYLALELCGPSLEKAVQDDTLQIDPLDLCVQMATGLQHMHTSTVGAAHGIVHLDLHPGNVLLLEEQGPGSRMIAKISDFGLARTMRQHASLSTMTHTGAGGWSAPEMRHAGTGGGLPHPKAADIFSLGCILFFSLTRGAHPFGDRHQRELAIARADDEARDFSSSWLVIRYAHRHLIEWMTRADPTTRPSADQVTAHPAMWSSAAQGRYLASIARRVAANPGGALAHGLQERGLEHLGAQTGNWQSLLFSAGVNISLSAGLSLAQRLLNDAAAAKALSMQGPQRLDALPEGAHALASSLEEGDASADTSLDRAVEHGVHGGCLGLLQQLRHMYERSQTPGGPSVPWPKVLKAVPWLLITATTLDAYAQSTFPAEAEAAAHEQTAALNITRQYSDSPAGLVPQVDLQLPTEVVEMAPQVTPSDNTGLLDSAEVQPVDGRAIDEPSGRARTSSSGRLESNPSDTTPDLIPIEEISFENRIDGGIGANGAVYKARWQSTEVAIKTAKGSGNDTEHLRHVVEELASEIKRVRGLNHPNITNFLGTCLGTPPHSNLAQLMLVNELLACSLYDQLHKLRRSRSKTIGWLPRVRWAFQISCGMEYLHHRKLVHLDLKSPNILLSVHSITATAKIADFGNLRAASAQTLSTRSRTLTNTLSQMDSCGSDAAIAADEGVPTRPTVAQASKLVETLERVVSKQADVAAEAGLLIGLGPSAGTAVDRHQLRAVLDRSASLQLQPQPTTATKEGEEEKVAVAERGDRERGQGCPGGGVSELARSVASKHQTMTTTSDDGALGTPEWMAPELLKGSSFASPQADVYSFSMVMYELLTGSRPFEGFPARETVRFMGPELVTIWALNGARPTVAANCPQPWAALMAHCWKAVPSERPQFSEVATVLKGMIDSGETRKWGADVVSTSPADAPHTGTTAAVQTRVTNTSTTSNQAAAAAVTGGGGGGGGGPMPTATAIKRRRHGDLMTARAPAPPVNHAAMHAAAPAPAAVATSMPHPTTSSRAPSSSSPADQQAPADVDGSAMAPPPQRKVKATTESRASRACTVQ
jgi:serine/threonine protein kinase